METMGTKQAHVTPWFVVREDVVRRKDGSTGQYWFVESGDIVLVVPLEDDGLHMVEQFRYPVGRRSWEFPAGTVDSGVDPDPKAAAARELREETGFTAREMSFIGAFDVTPSTLSQRCSVFLATGLTPGNPQRDLDEQDMRSAWFSLEDLEQMIIEGSLADAKSLAGYALLLASGAMRR